jgi:hypothetical protein
MLHRRPLTRFCGQIRRVSEGQTGPREPRHGRRASALHAAPARNRTLRSILGTTAAPSNPPSTLTKPRRVKRRRPQPLISILAGGAYAAAPVADYCSAAYTGRHFAIKSRSGAPTVLQRVKRGELEAVHAMRGRQKGLRVKVIAQQPGLFDPTT